ncbi:MAG: hypothetical protein ACFB50_14610 [Rubrobacteraceae bacterium]
MPSDELLGHKQKAMAAEGPYDAGSALRRDAEALGVRLFLSLPLPELVGPQVRYYADWLDEEGRRQPALDTDIYLWRDPVRLISRSLEAVAAQDEPRRKIVILDEDLAEVARLSP